jgi:hypothetical protein
VDVFVVGVGLVVEVLGLVVPGAAWSPEPELEHAVASSATAHPEMIALRINTTGNGSCSRGPLRRARDPVGTAGGRDQ